MGLNMQKAGFSLLELSVVLVIIGLVIGGVLLGRDMMRSAELQAVIKDIQKYQSALETFSDKYESMPGDMPDAEDYWGASNTDNGDGDGVIDTDAETIDLWNHLALAGIIEGSYSSSAATLTAGTSTPLTGAQHIYYIGHYCSIASCSNWAASAIDNAKIILAGIDGSTISAQYADVANYTNSITGFTNEEAMNLDRKIDDEAPLTGNFLAPVCSDLAAANKSFATSMNADDLLGTNNSLNYRLDDNGRDCFFFAKF